MLWFSSGKIAIKVLELEAQGQEMINMTFGYIGVTFVCYKTHQWAGWDLIPQCHQQMTLWALIRQYIWCRFRACGPSIQGQDMIYTIFRHIGATAAVCKRNVWVCWDLIPLGHQQMAFLAQIQQNICCRMWAGGTSILVQEIIHMTFQHIWLPHEGCKTYVCVCWDLIPVGHQKISLLA